MTDYRNPSADIESALHSFMCATEQDPRIGPSHISLFAAILYYYKAQGFHNPISVYSKELMKHAKIALGTYHRCIQELHSYGFIQYMPSYNPLLGSIIYLKTNFDHEDLHNTNTRA